MRLLAVLFTFGLSSFAFPAVSIEDANIPVLDMCDYYNPDRHDHFVHKITEACHEFGFFAVINAPIDPEIVDEAYDIAKEFFSLSLEEKEKSNGVFTNCQRGYIPLGREKGKGETLFDFKEYYMIGREMLPAQQRKLGYYTNIWPSKTKMKISMTRLFNSLEECMIPLQNAIEEGLCLKKNFLNEMSYQGDNTLRVIHYPSKNSAGFNIWSAAHTDVNLLSVLPSATADGLEIQTVDGEWLRLKVPAGAFVVNCADQLQNLTNGYCKSARHRVISTEANTEDRYSMVFFIHTRNLDRLDPIESCVAKTGGVRKYPNATRWDLLMERLIDINNYTPPMLEEFSKTGVAEQMIELDCASPFVLECLRDAGLASETVLNKLKDLES